MKYCWKPKFSLNALPFIFKVFCFFPFWSYSKFSEVLWGKTLCTNQNSFDCKKERKNFFVFNPSLKVIIKKQGWVVLQSQLTDLTFFLTIISLSLSTLSLLPFLTDSCNKNRQLKNHSKLGFSIVTVIIPIITNSSIVSLL